MCLALKCSILYIDIGSNDGETITQFITRQTENSLNTLLLNHYKFTMNEACIVGFEPNPRWTNQLKKIEKHFLKNVSDLNIHTNTAVVATDETFVNLSIDSSDNNVGSSIYAKRSLHTRKANTIKLSSFLEQYLVGIDEKTPILIRMDIEGYEYTLIPQLLLSGVFQKFKTYFMIEWHRYLKKRNYNFDYMFQHFNRAQSCSIECNSIYQNLEKVLTYMIYMSGGKTNEIKHYITKKEN